MDLGTLADGLGCFPFDYGPSHPQSDSQDISYGIRSLIRFGNLVGPLALSVLYLRKKTPEAIPQYISERTSYHQV